MNRNNEILYELKNVSQVLAEIPKTNPFSLPEGYFNNLAGKITAYVLLNKDAEINFGKDETLRVPQGYFASLSDHILARIKTQAEENAGDEIQQLSPLLFSLKDKNVFTIPANYFENVSNHVVNKVSPKKAKVISISKAKTFWKYAAAAVVTGAIAVSSLQIFNSSPDMKKNNSVVTESSGLPAYIESSFQYKTPEQVNEGISTLSDDVIVDYLEKHGNLLDNETLINAAPARELPAADDYLTDDDALNKYLNALDKPAAEKNK